MDIAPSKPHERILAAFSYLGPFVVVPLLVRRKQRFLAYHTRQGLYLFVLFLAAFILTFAPVYLMRGTGLEESALFVLFSVLLLLELGTYGVVSLFLAYSGGRGRMPMLPLLGDMAGEN